MKEAILQHERDLELALGKIERFFRFVTNEIKARQSGVYVQTGDAEAVIVIPKCGGGLAVRVRRWARVELGAMFTVGGEPAFRVSVVIGKNTGTVKMGNITDCG